jgi:2-haloacid dehalogenase
MSYEWVLFDADGTLFDFERTAARALERTFGDFELPYDPAYVEIYRSIDERWWKALERGEISRSRLHVQRFSDLLDHVGASREPKAFADRYLEHVAEGTDLIEGAERVVSELAERVHLALITNGFAEVQTSRFSRSSLTRHFEAIVISGIVGAAKPDPAIFDEVFRRMGSPAKSDVLMVGDSLTADIQGGGDYGIDTCWYNPEGHPVPEGMEITHVISDLAELLGIV